MATEESFGSNSGTFFPARPHLIVGGASEQVNWYLAQVVRAWDSVVIYFS